MKLFTKNMIILGFVVLLAVLPLYIARDAEFGGADGQASEAIMELNADYTPWFESFWEPPSGEIESLLFALQAAIGSGFVFYYLGYSKGKHAVNKSDQA
ncbi:energy-coupling factor ABC transporter substrate-binding protein [Desulfosporosinus shakirovi]|uniref:energy-coupling factor ABC transporter substrate-binding protein n=1 Tax=Desulfosporosinus shakirovi TaxID=2885154 RepID=UPI001E2E5EA5|nr:energy-coupling factor ABC transporter substrate-binding protein [Desulfosporosinus sp. SRJS8]MCB8815557.1 energy-coupling factor ABC transporter substrate-binding protein [Desulfosporosinus sp. SRJS8]